MSIKNMHKVMKQCIVPATGSQILNIIRTGLPRAVTCMLCAGRKPLESLLVDDVILASRAAAFQVGPQAVAEVKTIVVENARVSGSKRGISVQLHDSGNMHDIW